MKKIVVLGLIFAAALANAGPVPQEWKTRYASLLKVMERKDLATFKSMFSHDFVVIDAKGKKTPREAFFKEVDGMFAAADKAHGTMKLKGASTKGDVTGVDFDFTLKLQNKGGGTTTAHEVGVDYWKKIGGKWVMIRTVESVFTVAMTK